ncbi:MAG: adaptor protein MecA [Clostridiales bacterium]|nr:adaptor protein MecA [Clostridiales bacterium]
MKIDLTSDKQISVFLDSEDLESLDITVDEMDYNSVKTRKAIWSILDTARKETNVSLNLEGKLYIEVVPLRDGGCHIVFTTVPRHYARSRGKIKKSVVRPIIFQFENTDDLLQAIACIGTADLPHVRSDLYCSGKAYRMIVYFPFKIHDELATLLQFSKLVKGSVHVAVTKEHWEEIITDTALDNMLKANRKTA